MREVNARPEASRPTSLTSAFNWLQLYLFFIFIFLERAQTQLISSRSSLFRFPVGPNYGYLKSWRHQNNVCIDRKVAVYSSVTLEYLAAAGVSELAGTSGALSSLSMYLLVS